MVFLNEEMTMDFLKVTSVILALLPHPLCAFKYEGCTSTQYLELHLPGTIQCFFREGFYGLHWYDSTETVKNLPILNFQESTKSGSGFTSGEYDIHPNGSLIIHNVTVYHEKTFVVVKLNSSEQAPLQINVTIITTVHPHHDFPIIKNCRDQGRVCFRKVNKTMQLACTVRDIRPMVSLTWSLRGIAGAEQIPSASTVENGTVAYTSQATATIAFLDTSFLRLYVCKAFTLSSLLRYTESYIVAERGLLNLPSLELATKYFQRDSKMELLCNESFFNFLVWIRTTETRQVDDNSVLAIYVNDTFQEIYSEDYELGERGSLTVRQVKTSHEGTYTCLFGNGLTDGKVEHRVAVYVHPTPPNPIIRGCEDKSYCLLDAGNEGMLTCYINGIRPEVQLLLRPLYVVPPTTLSFYNQEAKVTFNGDTFDVTVTGHFLAKSAEDSRVTVQCKVVGPNNDLFDLSVQTDVLVRAKNCSTEDPDNPCDREGTATRNKSLTTILLVAILVIALFLIIGIAGFYTAKVYRRRRVQMDKPLGEEEELPMFSQNRRHNDRLDLSDRKKQFIKEVKIKYEKLFDAVKPIPYLKEKYCVNSIFMECEIEVRTSKTDQKVEFWEPVVTYYDIVNDTRCDSMRCILQGDAGYGKSTLTLQLAYEWCDEVTSPLADFEILVLLNLRQLGSTSSIFGAIRQFLLPRDTGLTENDIRTIFQNTSSVLIILDGYDEYSVQEHETDITLIINRDMLQQVPVILTTRSSCLPDRFPSNTKRFRLNGFNDMARERYIDKVVVRDDGDAAKRIKQCLVENPVLCDLCQVPLFFVMFAHMTYEKCEFQKFKSVTSFFTYMISCFHSHMRNKTNDNTELEKCKQFEDHHKQLDHLSLSGLGAKTKIIVWDKDLIISALGRGFYEHYVKIGLLVEDEVLHMDKTSKQFQYKTEVRFYHKIFCEWYAAQRLSEYGADKDATDLQQALKQLDPYDLHYVYRFACGLQPKAAHKILKYLECISVGPEFVALCTLEQMGEVDEIKSTIEYLSSDVVSLRNENNRLQLRSIIQILEIASTNMISVPCVSIENCFRSVDRSTWKISLGSGLLFSNLGVMKELRIYEIGRELTDEEVDDIYKFALHCLSLKRLLFDSCLLPMTIGIKTDHSHDQDQDQKEVLWNPVGTWYKWNTSTQFWEFQGRDENISMTPQQYDTEVHKFRKEFSFTHWQGCTNNGNQADDMEKLPSL